MQSLSEEADGLPLSAQFALVLSFPSLFWMLALLSPWTDKTNSRLQVAIAVVLLSLWMLAVVITFRSRTWGSVKLKRFVQRNPQLWIVAIYLLLALRDISVIPTCDNGGYYRGILEAVDQFNFNLARSLPAMKLAGHPSQAYTAYMMMGQFLDFANFHIANLQTYILHVVGILSFWGIVGYLFPGGHRSCERLLATALFAFTPLVFGLSLTVSPDFAVLAFLCLVIWSIMRGYTVLTVAAGVMLCFSKEAGAFLYACLLLGVFGLLVPYRVLTSGGTRTRVLGKELREVGHLLLPLAFCALYVATDGQLWGGATVRTLAEQTMLFPLDATTLRDKTIQMFVANFNWVVWGLIGMSIAIALLRRRGHVPKPPRASQPGIWFLVLGVTLAAFVLVNYTFRTWNNARYIVPVCLFTVLFLVRALESLVRRRTLRLGVLAVCLGLFAASCIRTFDPVLLRLFPTFRFGQHRMSFYNSVATVCDLTLYNHEYTYYNRLFDRFLTESGFDPYSDQFAFFVGGRWETLAVHNIEFLWAGGGMLGPLYIDPASRTRTYDAVGNPLLRSTIFVSGDTDASILPEHAFSIELFWIRKLHDLSLTEMTNYYEVVREIRVEEDGYSLVGYELARRE